jgi:hypothetical protein
MIGKTGTSIVAIFVAVAFAACFSADSVGNRGRSTPTPGKSVATPETTPSQTTNQMKETPKTGGFNSNLPSGFTLPQDDVGRRILREYGAMFVARGVKPPPSVAFTSDAEVTAFQSSVQSASESIGGINVELQGPALAALKEAIAEARGKGLDIRPRNADSSKRSYSQTVDNWKSRVGPGLKHWVSSGRLNKAEADRIAALSPSDQVPEIFKLEAQGMYFSQDLSKTIMYSVAPPGTSQHISMLALDVEQFNDAAVRAVLANHGWFQTIPSDLPHFTYLGAKESELASLGLKKTNAGGRDFWVPDI